MLSPPQIWKVFYIININNIDSYSIAVLNTFHTYIFIFYWIIINVCKFKRYLSCNQGFIKERMKFPCGNPLFWVLSLTSRFRIETFFIDTVKVFCLLHGTTLNNGFCCPGDVYIILKKDYQMIIDLHMIPHILGFYMGQM